MSTDPRTAGLQARISDHERAAASAARKGDQKTADYFQGQADALRREIEGAR